MKNVLIALALATALALPAQAQTSDADLKKAFDICMAKAGIDPGPRKGFPVGGVTRIPQFPAGWESCTTIVNQWLTADSARRKSEMDSAERRLVEDAFKGLKK
jgi:hypothetical protein